MEYQDGVVSYETFWNQLHLPYPKDRACPSYNGRILWTGCNAENKVVFVKHGRVQTALVIPYNSVGLVDLYEVNLDVLHESCPVKVEDTLYYVCRTSDENEVWYAFRLGNSNIRFYAETHKKRWQRCVSITVNNQCQA